MLFSNLSKTVNMMFGKPHRNKFGEAIVIAYLFFKKNFSVIYINVCDSFVHRLCIIFKTTERCDSFLDSHASIVVCIFNRLFSLKFLIFTHNPGPVEGEGEGGGLQPPTFLKIIRATEKKCFQRPT